MRHRSPVKINLSRIWREQPSDDVQEGGLAAAAGANEGDNLPMLDFQVDPVQHGQRSPIASEALADVHELEMDRCIHFQGRDLR